MNNDDVIASLDDALRSASSEALALSLQRYFPEPVAALGVSNAVVAKIAAGAMARAPELGPIEWADVADRFARRGRYHEHMMLASALMAKLARHPDPERHRLLSMTAWLERDVRNWAQCDDLCIKSLYAYFQRRPELLAGVIEWGGSASPWLRRASNVIMVKFVGRSQAVELAAMLANCARLLADADPYVQKGIGWLLKVASQHQREAVLAFLREHQAQISRPTLRYAIEKLPEELRQGLLA